MLLVLILVLVLLVAVLLGGAGQLRQQQDGGQLGLWLLLRPTTQRQDAVVQRRKQLTRVLGAGLHTHTQRRHAHGKADTHTI